MAALGLNLHFTSKVMNKVWHGTCACAICQMQLSVALISDEVTHAMEALGHRLTKPVVFGVESEIDENCITALKNLPHEIHSSHIHVDLLSRLKPGVRHRLLEMEAHALGKTAKQTGGHRGFSDELTAHAKSGGGCGACEGVPPKVRKVRGFWLLQDPGPSYHDHNSVSPI